MINITPTIVHECQDLVKFVLCKPENHNVFVYMDIANSIGLECIGLIGI